MPVKVKVKQTGRVRAPRLDDPQLKIIGDEMVAAQKARWAKGIDTGGQPAKKLSVKYAIRKGAYLRKVGDPRGSSRVIRDMNITGLLVKNFTLRRASAGVIRAENTTREARAHANKAVLYWDMIGFAGSDVKTVMDSYTKQYGLWSLRAFIPITSTGGK
jgi:hypothetical protein